MKIPISAALAIAFGLVVLAGYFIPGLEAFRYIFVHWAMILAAVAILVGVANLAGVHLRKLSSGQSESIYSGILLAALATTILVGIIWGPTGSWLQWIYAYIQFPVESSLMAILAVVLVYAVARLLRRKLTLMTGVFFATILFMLAGSVSWFGVTIPGYHGQDGLRALLVQFPAVAGTRGLLLGIALGTVATGLRVLLGADRPYED